MRFQTILAPGMGLLLALACLVFNDAAAAAPDGRGDAWRTEPGVSPPSYAITEPTESDLNVETIALVCSETAYGRTIELDLHVGGTGPLLPNGADPRRLKAKPSVEIVVDGRRFHAELLFSDDYVVVANTSDHRWPVLSAPLLEAMQNGRSMVLRFDLLEKGREAAMRFDSYLVVNLQAGHSAIAAVRRCALPDGQVASR